MTPQELAERAKVKQQQEEVGAALTTKRVELFQNSFSALLDDIEGWMAPFLANNTASITRVKLDLHDTTINARYEVEKAEIVIVGQKISFKPEYLYGLGHSCSVAISGFKQGASFLKENADSSGWLITKGSIRDAEALDESRFMKLIEPLIA